MSGAGDEAGPPRGDSALDGHSYTWNLQSDRIDWGSEGSISTAPIGSGLSWLSSVQSGTALKDRIPETESNLRLEALARAFRSGGRFESDYSLIADNGVATWVRDTGTVEFSDNGAPMGLQGIIRARANTDASADRTGPAPQTGLANRENGDGVAADTLDTVNTEASDLRDALNMAVYGARKDGTNGAYVVVGIDKLAMVNQAFGYEAADAVIAAVAERLRGCLRHGDTMGHIGGDRFGVVLNNCGEAELDATAEAFLEDIHRDVVKTRLGPIHVTVSIGAATFPTAAKFTQEVMTKADFALRSAKEAGRDRFVRYSVSETELGNHRRTMALAQEVHRALRDDRLLFAYQPIADSRTLTPRHYECLLRLKRLDGDVVVARDFMPVVETLGMTRRVDRAVLELAVKQLSQQPDVHLAINVSGATPSGDSWLNAARDLLRDRPEIAARMTVEITETAKIDNLDACARFVSTLRDLGCRVALDDFGVGYTSFNHLKVLAVSVMKIDASFVRGVDTNKENRAFVRAMLDLARSLGLETVAEGVETMDEVRALREEGVDLLQGYVLGMPEIRPPWSTQNDPLHDPLPGVPDTAADRFAT